MEIEQLSLRTQNMTNKKGDLNSSKNEQTCIASSVNKVQESLQLSLFLTKKAVTSEAPEGKVQ